MKKWLSSISSRKRPLIQESPDLEQLITVLENDFKAASTNEAGYSSHWELLKDRASFGSDPEPIIRDSMRDVLSRLPSGNGRYSFNEVSELVQGDIERKRGERRALLSGRSPSQRGR